jgi:proliferating cell nuclear antigen PCNA
VHGLITKNILGKKMHCVWKSGLQCLKLFKAIHHTNKMVNISMDIHGIHIMSMDMSKTSLVKLEFDANEFQSYLCSEPMTFGIHAEVMVNILQKVKKNKLVWQADDNAALTLVFIEDAQKTEFRIRTVDIDDDQLAIPELQDDVAIRVPKEVVHDWIDKMMMTKSDVHFRVTQTEFSCESTSTDMGTIKCSEPIGTDRIVSVAFRNPVDMQLSSYATKSMQVFAGTGGDSCFIGLSNEQPSRIKVELGDASSICLYVAPKISND